MASIRQIRRRIRSIENTAKVTKAMEMIAASKMRRAQASVLAGRPYSEKIQQVIADLAAQPSEDGTSSQPLLEARPIQRVGLVHITPDRGLCGGLHSNLNRRVSQFIIEQQVPATIVAVGRKGRDFMVRYGQDVKAVFINLGDRPALADTIAISSMVIDQYTKGEVDEVHLSYVEFVSTTVQRPVVKRLLPIVPAELTAYERVGYIYEPSGQVVLGSLLPRFVEMEIYHALLELIASEQSARMVAMRNATENAGEMVDDLTLLANKVRQESITNELLDILGGSEVLA
ncbi:MAG: ATP synthase F1 subunit gamma [Dehalococcoidia bacterium]|nr:ATP synthase F1 subunit gamma [Dehalococcoidia bacterium]